MYLCISLYVATVEPVYNDHLEAKNVWPLQKGATCVIQKILSIRWSQVLDSACDLYTEVSMQSMQVITHGMHNLCILTD